jgi:hypothetical protein
LVFPHQTFDAVADPKAVLELLIPCLLFGPIPTRFEIIPGIGVMDDLRENRSAESGYREDRHQNQPDFFDIFHGFLRSGVLIDPIF